ncbi:colicin E3/pyocin S6 family cytotoxin [Amycolatopsis sp. NPDC098790]|uniref:colicin E3/pyocin S6 family cytotoxin n=1 Tax=Amycolatopsis sp. NPDC098790 TaxID=3363939 RepID=UPI0037FFE740
MSPAKPKTSVQGGGGLRKRWKDSKGDIYEWDSPHGELETYDKRRRRLGPVDPATGDPIAGRGPVPEWTVEP